MPKLDLDGTPPVNATGYPEPFHQDVEGRWYRRLAPMGGLSHFGASHVTLKPGGWSSQRHWHVGEDELLVMIAGEAVLVEDAGRTVLKPGDVCAWPAGIENGHHLINESGAECVFVCISGGENAGGSYPDIDMMWTPDDTYRQKDGTPYPKRQAG